MSILVVGGSGATGRLLVKELLARGLEVKVLVRSAAALPAEWHHHQRLTLIEGTVLGLERAELARLLQGCRAIACCLGHNLSWRGIFGPPWRLVADSVRLLCLASKLASPPWPLKLVLMNTAGNLNPDAQERRSLLEQLVIALVRLLLPPQADNEAAANYLRCDIGRHDKAIRWVVVRPDSLTNDEQPSAYELHPSPVRSAIFNAGHTSRINVACFMAALLTDEPLWQRWQGQMPVIYNREDPHEAGAHG